MPQEPKSEIKRLRDQLELAQKARGPREDVWKQNINWYEGFQSPEFSDNDVSMDFDWVIFNLIKDAIDILVPSVYFRNPKVFLTPRRPQDLERRQINETIMNYEIQRMKLKIQMKRAVKDAFLTNFGCIKHGFDSEFRINDRSKGDNPNPENLLIDNGSIWNLRVSPFDFHIDPSANYTDLTDARYVVHSTDRFLDDIKKDNWFENTSGLSATKLQRAESEGRDELTDEFKSSAINLEHREMIRINEFWDRKVEKVFVFADGHDKILKKMPWPWKLGGFPFTILSFLYTPDKLYPRTDVENSLDVQDAMNQHISQIMAHGRRSLPRIGVKKKVKREIVAKLEEPYIDSVIHGLEEGDVFPIPRATTSPDVDKFIGLARDMMNISMKVNELQRGNSPKGVRTATAAGIIQQNTQITSSEKVDVVQDFFGEITEKNLKLIHQTYTLKKIVPITGDIPGVFSFREYTAKEIEGQFDVEIDPYSAVPRDPQTERQNVIALVNLLAHPMFAQNQQVQVNLLELAKMLLDRFDIKNVDKILPLAAQQTQNEQDRDPEVENLLLAAGDDLPVSPKDNDQEHISQHLTMRDALANEDRDVSAFDRHLNLHNQQLILKQQSQGQGQGQQNVNQNVGITSDQGFGLIPGLENLLRQNGSQVRGPEQVPEGPGRGVLGG